LFEYSAFLFFVIV